MVRKGDGKQIIKKGELDTEKAVSTPCIPLKVVLT